MQQLHFLKDNKMKKRLQANNRKKLLNRNKHKLTFRRQSLFIQLNENEAKENY